MWSSACSTGEEPYSLAMTLLETRRVARRALQIKATDISPRALELVGGILPRTLVPRDRARDDSEVFQVAGDGFMIGRAIKWIVYSAPQSAGAPARCGDGPGRCDFLPQRADLFRQADPKEGRRSLRAGMRPGGFLFLGHAESIIRMTELYEPISLPRLSYYRLKGRCRH